MGVWLFCETIPPSLLICLVLNVLVLVLAHTIHNDRAHQVLFDKTNAYDPIDSDQPR